MAKDVVINGVTYSNVPQVEIPKSGGGTATFYDTDPATASSTDILVNKTAFVGGGLVYGEMPNNGAISGEIYTVNATVPVNAGYTEGGYVQIGQSEQNKIIAGNIKSGVTILGVSGASTVKDVSDTTATQATVLSGYYFYTAGGSRVQGSATVPTISQDSTTKVLSIS